MTAMTNPAPAPRQPADAGPVLETLDLHLTFSGRGLRRGFDARAVDGVNLQIRPGEIVALAGESGCGKTTLARTILGLEKADERRHPIPGPAARLLDEVTARLPPRRATRVAGPDRCAEPAPVGLRGGRRGHPDPQDPRQRGAACRGRVVPGRIAAARALLPLLSARAVRRPAAARRHRRRAWRCTRR